MIDDQTSTHWHTDVNNIRQHQITEQFTHGRKILKLLHTCNAGTLQAHSALYKLCFWKNASLSLC